MSGARHPAQPVTHAELDWARLELQRTIARIEAKFEMLQREIETLRNKP